MTARATSCNSNYNGRTVRECDILAACRAGLTSRGACGRCSARGPSHIFVELYLSGHITALPQFQGCRNVFEFGGGAESHETPPRLASSEKILRKFCHVVNPGLAAW